MNHHAFPSPHCFCLFAYGAARRFFEYCFEPLESHRLPLPFLLCFWWNAVRRLPGMIVLRGSIQMQFRAYHAKGVAHRLHLHCPCTAMLD